MTVLAWRLNPKAPSPLRYTTGCSWGQECTGSMYPKGPCVAGGRCLFISLPLMQLPGYCLPLFISIYACEFVAVSLTVNLTFCVPHVPPLPRPISLSTCWCQPFLPVSSSSYCCRLSTPSMCNKRAWESCVMEGSCLS